MSNWTSLLLSQSALLSMYVDATVISTKNVPVTFSVHFLGSFLVSVVMSHHFHETLCEANNEWRSSTRRFTANEFLFSLKTRMLRTVAFSLSVLPHKVIPLRLDGYFFKCNINYYCHTCPSDF
jgi:hypothetical protein